MIMDKKLIPNFLFIIVVLITTISIYKVGGNNFVLLSNFLIILLSLLFMIFGDKYNFSLNKVFMLFVFFFFGVAPAIQYQKGITLWWGSAFSDDDYIFQNILIISIILFYQATYCLSTYLKPSIIENKINRSFNKPKKISINRLVIVSLLSMVMTLFFYRFSITDLLLRSGQIVKMDQSLYLIYSNFLRPLPIVVLVFFKQFEIKNKKVELFLIISSLITNFPTATPRFYAAAMFIPLIIIYYEKIRFNYLKLNRLLIYGFMLIFPMLDQFRRIDSLIEARFSLDFNMFSTEHFDSYQMFMRVINENIITNGKQLITSVLFFIPRSIWANKSIGSGALVAKNLEFQFMNVSMNYFGEGYINFGYFGIVLFVIVLATINARLDKLYWKINRKSNSLSIFYYFLLGLEFFVLRGDLLSAFAFTSGIFASVVFVQKICTKHIVLDNDV